MLTAEEIRRKYKSTLTRGKLLSNCPYTCDKCHKKVAKVGTKQIYSYGYQQYCSKCIVPIVKTSLKKGTKKKFSYKKLKINVIKRNVNPQIKKVRKAIKRRL